jgi:hypothetical protein
MKQELMSDYKKLLPDLEPHEWRRVRGEQDLIVRYEPERALATLPLLLRDPADREKLVTLVNRLVEDERVRRAKPSSEQIAMLSHIGETLNIEPLRKPRRAPAGKTARKTRSKTTARRQRA